MGTITLNLVDETEKRFRKVAGITFGTGKGSLGKAAGLAFDEWVNKHLNNSEVKMLEFLEKGIKMGKISCKSRDEIHER